MDLIEGIFTDATVHDGPHLLQLVAQTVSGHLVCEAQGNVRRTIQASTNDMPPRPSMPSLLFKRRQNFEMNNLGKSEPSLPPFSFAISLFPFLLPQFVVESEITLISLV